jgi:hypothetical protein
MTRSLGTWCGAIGVVIVFTARLAAQVPAAEAIDPIRCWWRTSVGAVAVGEAFAASLTCAVRNDDAIRVALDESRLAAAVVQLSPFEVLGGTHPGDLLTPTHRFVQYHYSLRIIDRDIIGHDAKFPDLQLPYKVQSTVGGESVEGRDRAYIVPGQPVRVLSLVPIEADDIRDSAGEDFAAVEALRFRGRALRIVASTLGALGLVVLVPAIFRLARGRERREAGRGRLDARQLLPDVAAALARVESARTNEWTPELVSRALCATRLAAASALDRPISQRALRPGEAEAHERLTVRRGWLRRSALTTSSAVSAIDLEAALRALPLTATVAERQRIEDLRQAVAAFTSASYGRAGIDGVILDEALAAAMRVTNALRRTHAWPRSLWSSVRQPAPTEARG